MANAAGVHGPPNTCQLFQKSGQFRARRLTTTEANLWLKEVLVHIGLSTALILAEPQYRPGLESSGVFHGGKKADDTSHGSVCSDAPYVFKGQSDSLHSRICRMLAAIRNFESIQMRRMLPESTGESGPFWGPGQTKKIGRHQRAMCLETSTSKKGHTSGGANQLQQALWTVRDCCIRNPW